jgi:transcriptional regulator with XRE-family HTH domain
MRIDQNTTDDAVLAEFGERLARARLSAGLSRAALAADAGVAERTIVRLEEGESTTVGNLIRVLRPLGLLESLDALIPEQVVNPFTEIAQRGTVRRRAARAGSAASPSSPSPPAGRWVWGDETPPEGA